MRPNTLDPDEVLEVLQAAAADGVTDDLNGGVPLKEIADRLERNRKSRAIKAALEDLKAEDRVAEVWGLNPESGYSRTSYLPLEDSEAET